VLINPEAWPSSPLLVYSFRIKIKKFYVQPKGVVAELHTPIYVTFVIAVATALTVRMIFAIDTVMMTTADVARCRRIRICWKRQVIN
jgi:hypothetical protein